MPEHPLLTLSPQEFLPSSLQTILANPTIHPSALHHHYRSFLITDNHPFNWQKTEDHFVYFDNYMLGERFKLSPASNLRPIAHFTISHMTDQLAFLDMFEVNESLHRQGIGSLTLEKICRTIRKCNYQFFAGFQNDAELASFFMHNHFYLWEELTAQGHTELAPLLKHHGYDEGVYVTIRPLSLSHYSRVIQHVAQEQSPSSRIDHQLRRITKP